MTAHKAMAEVTVAVEVIEVVEVARKMVIATARRMAVVEEAAMAATARRMAVTARSMAVK